MKAISWRSWAKTARPSPAASLSVDLKHSFFRDAVQTTLQSDARGRIVLGELAGIDWVRVMEFPGITRVFSLSEPLFDLPGVIHGSAGETIRIPRIPSIALARNADGRPWALFEIRGDAWVSDGSGSVRVTGGGMAIEGLPAGDYDLILKARDAKIRIRIGDRRTDGGLILSDHRILASGEDRALAIDGIRADDDAVYVTLKNGSPSARLHVLATRFMPVFHPFRDLVLTGLPGPYAKILRKPPSLYEAGRYLGDEYRYILERKYAEKYPGNMLERPRFLLNPWDMGGTETRSDLLREQESFAGRAGEARPVMAAEKAVVSAETAARGMKKAHAAYSNALNVRLIENYGRLHVSDAGARTPLAAAYIKVYARMTDGRVVFYKDGYTDHRGQFDYVSLSTDALNRVERFAVLVLSDTHGAAVREADPPKR
jgi:hypothetical protein